MDFRPIGDDVYLTYPKDTFVRKKETRGGLLQTIAVTPNLTQALPQGFGQKNGKTLPGESPLKVHSYFSRFQLTIINKTREKSAWAMYPIEWEEATKIRNRYKKIRGSEQYLADSAKTAASVIAAGKEQADDIKALLKSNKTILRLIAESQGISLPEEKADSKDSADVFGFSCYKQTFFAGEFAGKTPAEVGLMENGYEKLEKQFQFLKANVEKYPKNQTLMQAINEAASLLKKGMLKQPKAASPAEKASERVEIYHSSTKVNIHEKREDGLSPLRELVITYVRGMSYPVEVRIRNVYTKGFQTPEGKTSYDSSVMKDPIELKYLMSEDDMDCFIENIDEIKEMFRGCNPSWNFNAADKVALNNRRKAEQEKKG